MAVISAEEGASLIDADYYYRHGYPWETWAKLRESAPVCRIETDIDEPVWAVTRYNDIVEIERNPDVFLNAPRMNMGSGPGELPVRMIVNMDPPDHGAYRKLVNARFMPRSIATVQDFIERLVARTLDNASAQNGEIIDLQEFLANPVPTAVISKFLGAPEEMAPMIQSWTEQSLYPGDPEVAQGRSVEQVRAESIESMFAVYRDLFEERRKQPQDDLLTDLLNSRINGEEMPELELYSWCYILTLAGHETTQSTFGAAIHTLKQHPDQLRMLRDDHSLINGAIEEVLRFVSPAVHFCRTPNRDVELHGQIIPAGEPMVMYYPSGNHDETVFDRPDTSGSTRPRWPEWQRSVP
ncbi:MAG: cytochrome P450 [Novosphingobium sp.]|nr:cytochrome P450 [Novosphingobium sp.]